jgi:nucleotide-binding universal stress UspA family protein
VDATHYAALLAPGEPARLEEVPMQTILVPLDGSAVAEQVIPYVRVLAHVLAAKVHLLRVITNIEEQQLIARYAADPVAAEVAVEPDWEWEHRALAEVEATAREYLAAQAQALRSANLDVSIEVSTGAPAETIAEVAANRPQALITMATHGYQGLRRLATGSVADCLVRTTTTPMFLVHEGAARSAQAWTMRRILVPLDGSALARQALPLARTLATRAPADLVLLRAVVAPADQAALPAACQEARRQLAVLTAQLGHQQLRVEPVVTSGDPAEAIVSEASRRAVDVIVMATHGYGGVKRWTLGSVADSVLHATPTPLLLVRPHMTDQVDTSN